MALADNKITDTDISTNGIISAPDQLTGTAAQNKALFDKLIKDTVKVKFNEIIDDLVSTADGASGADQIGATALKTSGAVTVQGQLEELYTTEQADKVAADAALATKANQSTTYTKTEVDGIAGGKVDKVTGKGLSVNDYDNTEKASVAANTAAKHTHSNKTTLDNITAAYTTAEQAKLSGIATGATANSADATLLNRANHTGTQSADTIVDGATNKVYTTTEKTKLAAITGTNTGDETTTTIKTKLGITTLSGSNTGDQDLTGYMLKSVYDTTSDGSVDSVNNFTVIKNSTTGIIELWEV